jgi:Mg2+ and Co2+ transporter CorA
MAKALDSRPVVSGPLAHDLINKLAVIVGHCDLMREDGKKHSQYAKRVDSIQNIAVEMAAQLHAYQFRLSRITDNEQKQTSDIA